MPEDLKLIYTTLLRVEAKLDALLAAVDEEVGDESVEQLTLDGTSAGVEREPGESLG